MSARVPALRADIRSATQRLQQARRELARGDVPHVEALLSDLAMIDREFTLLSHSDSREIRPAALALLEEVVGLTADLARAQAEMALRLRASAAQQRARAAYRQPRTR